MANPARRQVYSARNVEQAYMIRGMLNAAGIEATVLGDLLQNAVGELPAVAIAPTVWVAQNDFETARSVIEEQEAMASRDRTEAADWTCSTCGEENAGTFDLCWHCGTAGQALE